MRENSLLPCGFERSTAHPGRISRPDRKSTILLYAQKPDKQSRNPSLRGTAIANFMKFPYIFPCNMNPPSHQDWIPKQLEALHAAHRLRTLRPRPDADVIDLTRNDYLALIRHPQVIRSAQAALEAWGSGAGASRLVSGSLPCHETLESRLAAWKGKASALLFGSGFLTNCGVIPALVGRGDVIFADRLVHASMLDGARLSEARLIRFRHNDLEHLADLLDKHRARKSRMLVLSESVFSMDGDLAPVTDLTHLCRENLLMIDEAHAVGVFGPGRCLDQPVDLCMGTLSKALASYGGYVALNEASRDLLVNCARSLIYSTGLPPAAVGAALGALDVLNEEPKRGKILLQRAAWLRKQLRENAIDVMQSESQIIPIRIGPDRETLDAAERLQARGVHVVAIRPPTVPEGSARLRLSINYSHSEEDLQRVAEILTEELRP